jgi:hypothetical protein
MMCQECEKEIQVGEDAIFVTVVDEDIANSRWTAVLQTFEVYHTKCFLSAFAVVV